MFLGDVHMIGHFLVLLSASFSKEAGGEVQMYEKYFTLQSLKKRFGIVYSDVHYYRITIVWQVKALSVEINVITLLSGLVLEIPIFFFSVFFLVFWSVDLPQTSSVHEAKQIFATNFCYTTWARILSDRNIFCTLRGGRTTTGLMPLGLFLLFFEICQIQSTWLQNITSGESKHAQGI